MGTEIGNRLEPMIVVDVQIIDVRFAQHLQQDVSKKPQHGIEDV